MGTTVDNLNNSKQEQECSCQEAPFGKLISYQELGMDDRYAEVSLLVCPFCSRIWLRYFFEMEAFTASGRWFLGQITIEQARHLKAENARQTLEGLSWYFIGGSYYDGQIRKSSGVISI